jgi:hypothetical protein
MLREQEIELTRRLASAIGPDLAVPRQAYLDGVLNVLQPVRDRRAQRLVSLVAEIAEASPVIVE